CERRPVTRWWAGASTANPSSFSCRIARGVRPSPQALSRAYSSISSRVTSWPARASQSAAADPDGPPPTTRRDGEDTGTEDIGPLAAGGIARLRRRLRRRYRSGMERETLDWAGYGIAARELAAQVADSGYRPDIILAIAR